MIFTRIHTFILKIGAHIIHIFHLDKTHFLTIHIYLINERSFRDGWDGSEYISC